MCLGDLGCGVSGQDDPVPDWKHLLFNGFGYIWLLPHAKRMCFTELSSTVELLKSYRIFLLLLVYSHMTTCTVFRDVIIMISVMSRQAQCCKDHEHCCPAGYTCSSGGECRQSAHPLLASLTTETRVQALENEVAGGVGVVCPDQQSQCPDRTTCCPVGSGKYGCCPFDQVCVIEYLLLVMYQFEYFYNFTGSLVFTVCCIVDIQFGYNFH